MSDEPLVPYFCVHLNISTMEMAAIGIGSEEYAFKNALEANYFKTIISKQTGRPYITRPYKLALSEIYRRSKGHKIFASWVCAKRYIGVR